MNTVIYVVLGIVLLLIILAICVKSPQGKWFFGTICMVIMIAGTCYCGIQLNYYYTASGGIFGKLSGIFETNVVEVENASFSFINIELTQTKDESYSAVITSSDVLQLENGIVYGVKVNGEPCVNVENARDYVTAEYTYSFYNERFEVLCTDTLYFRFAFYTNSTLLTVKTNGGANAVKFWNYYFNKNTFIVTIGQADYVKSEDIEFKNVKKEGYSLATFYEDNKLIGYKQVKNDDVVGNVNLDNMKDRKILGWKVGGEYVNLEDYRLNIDTRFDLETAVKLTIREKEFSDNGLVSSAYYNSTLKLNEIIASTSYYKEFENIYIGFTDANGRYIDGNTKLTNLTSTELYISVSYSISVPDFNVSKMQTGNVHVLDYSITSTTDYKFYSKTLSKSYSKYQVKFGKDYTQNMQVLLDSGLVSSFSKTVDETTNTCTIVAESKKGEVSIGGVSADFTLSIRVDENFNFYLTYKGDSSNKLKALWSQYYNFALNPRNLTFNTTK